MSATSLALIGVALTACGQRGPLYLPTTPAAKARATLPELLAPGSGSADEAKPPSAGASAPSAAAAASAPTANGGAK